MSTPSTLSTDLVDYTAVCRVEDIDAETGVAALVQGVAVAIFRTHDDQVFALSNYDPIGKASVLARGIIGTRAVDGAEVAIVTSPLYKQAFDLRTGFCLDDAAIRVPAYEVIVADGQIWVGGAKE